MGTCHMIINTQEDCLKLVAYNQTLNLEKAGPKPNNSKYAKYTLLSRRLFRKAILSQDFEAVPYPKEKYGKFHVGDSYIVLSVSIILVMLHYIQAYKVQTYFDPNQ